MFTAQKDEWLLRKRKLSTVSQVPKSILGLGQIDDQNNGLGCEE
jgi:hypothetical protein